MDIAIINRVKELGYDVYMRDTSDTYLFYTDGKAIGYLESDRYRGIKINTVHRPNRASGTGFRMLEELSDFGTPELRMGFMDFPHWAYKEDRESVRKWKDIGEFINADSWNRGFIKV